MSILPISVRNMSISMYIIPTDGQEERPLDTGLNRGIATRRWDQFA